MSERKPCYIWDEKTIEECDRLPAVVGRASMVHDLIEAYGILTRLQVVRSSSASFNDLKAFHVESYINHLKKFIDVDDEYITTSEDESFGIGYDCPPVSNMYDLVSHIAGSSITAAKCLILDITDVAMNWCGGWHHSHKFGAEGFCYVNDIVLAIEILRKKFNKVLYIDLDVHHGNGVQDAYSLSKSVFTLSFHKYEPGFYPGTGCIEDIGSHEPGFYPGTGCIEDIGSHAGIGYTCNFPLHAAYSDETMEYAFQKVFNSVYEHFEPEVIVIQCGADALARDPNGGANLTTRSYCRCVQWVLDKRKPILLLGGGGYKHPNAACLWASLTAMVAGVELDDQIPEHNHWPKYGPDYTLAVEATLTKDSNKKSYIEQCINKIEGNLIKYLGKTDIAEPVTKRMKTELIPNKLKEISNEVIKKKRIFVSEQSVGNVKLNATKNNDDVYEFVD